MSVAQELRTATANLEAANLRLEQANARIAEMEGTVATHEATIAQQAAQISEQQTAIGSHEAAMQALRDEHATATAGLAAQVETLTAENGQMKEKLKNPSFKLAGAAGEDPKTAGGGGEGGQDGSVLAQYKGLTGAAKTKFYRENKAELQKLGA